MAIGTATNNLRGFMLECVEVLRGLFDNAYIPDDPTLSPGIFPYVTMYGASAEVGGMTPQELIWKNNPTIVVVVPMDDIAKATEYLSQYWEQIPIALQSAFIINGRSSHAQNLGDQRMQLTMGPIDWPSGQEMFGITLTLFGVKITNVVPLIG